MDIGAIGKFQILKELGSGAHSKILHIRRSADSKQYALKVVDLGDKEDQKYLDQAEHELRVARMLDHPNLLKVFSLELVRDWLFRVRKAHLLLEYVNGQTLDTVKGLSLPRLVQVFERIAAGLVHMHRRGVYHADLKPGNLMLSRSGEVKIIDFGLAHVKGEAKGRVQGTPEYMAPEQSARGTVNESTDIYNFGATMYRLVTWRLPPSTLPSAEGLALTAKVFQSLLKPVKEYKPDCPKRLAELIEKCLSFNATLRPERVSEVQGTLDKLVEEMVRSEDDKLETMEW